MADQVEILNSCLRAIESGESTLEACIARYPDEKGLAVLLRLVTAVRQQEAAVKMPEVRKVALERRLIQVMQTRQRQPRHLQAGLRLLAGVAALLIVATLSGVGLARIAQYAVPGDPLYGYKRAVESAELRFAGASGQSTTLENIANARFHEIEVLAIVRHQQLDASFLADVAQSVQAAAQADSARRNTLYQRYQGLLDLADKSSVIKPDVLGTAIAALLSPTPTLTLIPTLSLTPTFTASATQAASPTLSPTPQPTVTSTYTATELPTLTAVDTTTPIPPTVTAKVTATITPTDTVNTVALPTTTPVPTLKRPTATNTFTAIPTIILPTATSTPLPGQPLAPVPAATLPPSNTATFTATATPITPSATLTATRTVTHAPTKTNTLTKTSTPTMTFTYSACPSMTPTFTVTPKGYKASPATATATEAPVTAPCLTWTPTPMPTDTPVPTNTLEPRHVGGTQAASAAGTVSIETATR